MAGSSLPPIDWLQLGSSFLLVLGLLAVALAWLRRLQSVNPARGRQIRILESHSTAPRQRLILVRVRNRDILVGVSPGRMDGLGEWPAPADDAEPADPPMAGKKSFPPSTQEMLARFLNKRRA